MCICDVANIDIILKVSGSSTKDEWRLEGGYTGVHFWDNSGVIGTKDGG